MRARVGRLPKGRHGLPPEQVAEAQRWRLIGAAAEVLAEHGYLATTSTRVVHVAGVSSRTFYDHFDSIEDLLLAAYEMAADCVWELVSAACADVGEWPQGLRAGIDAAVEFFVADPALANLLGSEASVGLTSAAIAHERLVDRLARLLAADRQLAIGSSRRLAPTVEPHLIAATMLLFGDRIATDGVEGLAEFAAELADVLCGFYPERAEA